MPVDKVPPTPVQFVDSAAEVHRLCEEWRVLATEKYTNSIAAILEGKDAPAKQYCTITPSPLARSFRGRYRLGIDLEGRNLGHAGTVDILAIYDGERNVTYLFDICVLQEKAFTKGSKGEWSLKELIEVGGAASPDHPAGGSDKAAHEESVKAMLVTAAETAKATSAGTVLFLVYDTRMDAAALFHIYGVRLGGASQPDSGASATIAPTPTARMTPFGGVYDLQVAKCHLAGGSWLIGLAKALSLYLSPADNAATEKGRTVFAPERGGDYAQWASRPLNKDLLTYCAVTIRYYVAFFDDVVATAYGMSFERVMATTAVRIERQVAAKVPKPGAQRDF